MRTYIGPSQLHALNRHHYQVALNKFAKTHAKRTTSGFHKQIRAAVLDAIEEGLIDTDFTRRVIITGREKSKEKVMFLSYSEWQILIHHTSKKSEHSFNLIIYLSAVTGLRFAEVLGLTLEDIDFKSSEL